jgi:hypothetical protein
MPKAATGLDYKDPSGTGWRLVKDASSTATHLVLNLVGPAGEKGRGAGFNLRSNGQVKFTRFSNGTYINDLGVLQLGNKDGATDLNGTPATKEVYAMFGGVKEGGKLITVSAFQKDRRYPAQDIGKPLFQIAMDFDPATTPSDIGTVIPLAVVKARAIPEYIGDSWESPTFDYRTILNNYVIQDITVAVGTLATK